MAHPTDTVNFDTLPLGVNTIAPINQRLGQLSYAITQLQKTLVNSIDVTAGEDLSDNDSAYINPDDNKMYAIDSDATPVAAGAIRGVVKGAVVASATGKLQFSGLKSGFTGLTAFQPLYADTTGAGTYTQTRPVPSKGGGQIAIVEMGYAISSTQIIIRVKPVVYALRDAMAEDDELTIEHHADENGHIREIQAFITEDVAGAALAQYADSNQDSDVALCDRTPATYTADLCTGGTASAGGSSGGAASNAFDGTNAYWGNSVATWLKYDLGAGNDDIARQYTITAETGPSAPNTWTFEGSNDDSNWDVLDTQSSETGWAVGEKRTYQFPNSTSYRYYRWNITAFNGGAVVAVREAEVMAAATYNDGPDALAQGFQISSADDVQKIRLWLKKVGTPTGNLTVKIETDSSGDPSGTIVTNGTSDTVAASSLSTSYGWIEFTFTTPPSLTGSTQYHIVLETTDTYSETDYVIWGADSSTPSYSDGEMKSESSSTWSAESADAIFEVYAPGISHPSKIAIDWWDSGYADIVNRYGDGLGVDIDTKTTFKCIAVAGFDDITLEVLLR